MFATFLHSIFLWAALFLAGLLPAPALGNDNLKLVIGGGNKTLKNNIRHHLDLERLPCTASELHLHNALSRSDNAISNALRALGYYHGEWQIEHNQTTTEGGEGKPCWRVEVTVIPGEPTLLTALKADIKGEGASDQELTTVLSKLPLKEGKKLNHSHYDQSKRMIQRRATTLGYFSSHYQQSTLTVDTESRTAVAILNFDSGPRYRFGAINYPVIPLNKDLLERYQTFASGDQYNADTLIAFQSNLINSQYFDNVSVNQGEPDPDTRAIDIDLDLQVKPRYESTFGAGFSTNLGPKASYVLKNRRFNGDGDTYQLSSQYSPVQSNLGLQYVQPGSDPVKEKTLWSTGWRSEDSDTLESTAYIAEVSRVKVLDNGWLFTRSLSLLNEEYEIADGSNTSILLYPGVHLARSKSNDTRYPTKGWRLAAGLKAGAEELVSDTSFVQATLDGKVIFPLAGGRVISRGGFGATWVDAFATLPTSLRFFAGGDNSVRGFDYQALGPTNSEGEVVGGKNLITGSLEYDYPVMGDYSIAAFYDAGTAFDTRQFKLYESAGFGVRWFSPIGPIRVDFAFPLEEGGFRLHLSMGPDL